MREDTKQKFRVLFTGRVGYWLGKKRPKETIEKMVEASKKQYKNRKIDIMGRFCGNE